MKLIILIGLLVSAPLWAIEGIWDYSADAYSKNKTGYYVDQKNIHIEAEIFDYNQDLTTQKEALGYLRSDILIDFADESSFEFEMLGDRSNQLNSDVDNITGYFRHLNPITTFDLYTLSFLTQLTLPMNRNAFEEEEGPRPVLGLNLELYHSERFSTSMSIAMSNSSDLQLKEWTKTYINSFYLAWTLTDRLSAVVDLYFQRDQGSAVYGYKWMVASLNYELSNEINVNLGTRTVGDEDAATNTMLGATLIF